MLLSDNHCVKPGQNSVKKDMETWFKVWILTQKPKVTGFAHPLSLLHKSHPADVAVKIEPFDRSSFPVSHKVGNVVNFVLGIEIKGIWSNSINLVLQLK